MYAGAIEAYEHAVIFARPFRVRGVAIETQAVAFFTTQGVEQFVSVFVIIRYAGHYRSSSLCFAPELIFFVFFKAKRSLRVCILNWNEASFSSFFLLMFFKSSWCLKKQPERENFMFEFLISSQIREQF